MKELLQSLDWNTLVSTIWTVVLLPVLTFCANEIQKYAKAQKVDKYTQILQDNVVTACKDVYETIVKDIKGTDDWTEEKMSEVKEIAKSKAIFALSNSAYECLKQANGDFDDYLDSLIEAVLYDLKH